MCSCGGSRPAPASPVVQACRARPMMCQEMPNSCGIASTRMLIQTITGNNPTEASLRQQSQNHAGAYAEPNGTRMDNLTHLLNANGVSASNPKSGQSLDDVANSVDEGNPAIAHFNSPAHFMVVDGVYYRPDGTRVFIVRDPWCGGGPGSGGNGRREMTDADMNNRNFSGWTITTD